MQKKQIAIFTISDVFIITGRGLVMTGTITQGDFSVGDYIEFVFSGTTRSRKIAGISPFRRSEDWQGRMAGILINCTDQKEMEELRSTFKAPVPAFIYAGG